MESKEDEKMGILTKIGIGILIVASLIAFAWLGYEFGFWLSQND